MGEMIKNLLKYFVYFIIFAAIGAGGAYLFFKMKDVGKADEVPALAEKNIQEAADLLNKGNWSLSITAQEFDENIPEGNIIRQLVAPGEKLRKNSKVGVIVSKGREREIFLLPSFEGQLLDEAKLSLANFGIKIGKVTWVHSDTAEKGVIITQRPVPGSVSAREVNFLVSFGAYDVFYKCPSFVNMTPDEARMLTEKLGLELVEQGEGSKVISQKPEPGAIIKKGDTVEVTIGSRMWF